MEKEPRFALSPTNIAALIGGLMLALILWQWMRSPAKPAARAANHYSAPTEIDHVIFAVRRARSWHVSSTGQVDGKAFVTLQDVMCPSDSHTVTQIPGVTGPQGIAEEFVETGGKLYAHEGGQPWHEQPNGGSDKCSSGPMAGPVTLIGILDNLKLASSVKKGQLVRFEGGSCRMWTFGGDRSTNASVSSICVDDASYLPYELRIGSLKVEYSSWNRPIVIEIPVVQ